MRAAVLCTVALLALVGCKREARPRYVITDEGSGEPPGDVLLPLRPGYLALAPDVETAPAFAMVTRRTEVDGGDGFVLQFGLAAELPRFDVVLDETRDGLVARVAGGQILDPPWVILPAEPRDGMTWQIVDKDDHVLANGSVARGEPIAWPLDDDPSAPAVTGSVRPWILTFDVVHHDPSSPEGLAGGQYTIEEWEEPIRRPAKRAPIAPQPHFRDFNPLSASGGAMVWALVEGEGFVADSALIPSEVVETPVARRQAIEPMDAGDGMADLTDAHVYSVTANRADPRYPSAGTLVQSSGIRYVSVPPDGLFMTWDDFALCRGVDLPSGEWLGQDAEGNFFSSCPDATHFEVGDDGVATAPTFLGYTPFHRIDPWFNPGQPDAGTSLDYVLVGAIQGLYRAADGTIRGLAHTTTRAQITHDGEVVPDDLRDPALDGNLPFVGNTYWLPIDEAEDFATPFGEPVMGEVLRAVVLRPEGADGAPVIVDSWPFLGHGVLRRPPEGSPTVGYLPDFAVDALIADPMTVVYEGDGRRSAYVALAHGAVHELDVDGDALVWRSLGRPELPDRHVVLGAWREGDHVALITQHRVVATGLFEGIAAWTTASVHAWRMPVEEGEWEPLPTHLYPGVDALSRRPDHQVPEDQVAPSGLDRVVCAPDGVDLDDLAFDGRETRVVPTDDRCALALRDGFAKDPAAITGSAAELSREPATLRFYRDDLGDVVVRGRGSFTPLGGRHVVPRERWEALANAGLPTVPGRHYESLASPYPTNDVFPGSPGLIDDPGGDGTWAVLYDTLAECGDFATEPQPCFELRYAPSDGGAVRTHVVPAWFGDHDPDERLLPFDPLRGNPLSREPSWRIHPAADTGLFVSVLQYGAGVGFSWVGPDGGGLVGTWCLDDQNGAPTSPDGARPPYYLHDNGTCATRWDDPHPRSGANDNLLNVPEPPPGHLEALYGARDGWRGVYRSNALEPAAVAFLAQYGGPVSTINELVGPPLVQDLDPHARRLVILHPHETGTPWLLYATDAFHRPVELLAAGVAAPIARDAVDASRLATWVRPLDLPFLPHDVLRRPIAGCDPETEVATTSGGCACAFEHEPVGGVCTPILGGSYRPAPGCAAIAAARGSAPAFAFVDPDGTSGYDDPSASAVTAQMDCRGDGLSALGPDPRWGIPPAPWDAAMVGAFELTWTVTSAWPEGWVGLYEGPPGSDAAWAERPIAALEGDRPDRIDLPQRLLFRVRSEVVDLGDMIPGAYRWTRDDAGTMRIFRDGVELVARPLDVSPLYVSNAHPTGGTGMSPSLTLAAKGVTCLPDGRDYGAGLCVLDPQDCAERGHECGNGDDGAFGRIECGPPVPGSECHFARNLCVPDDYEPSDGPGYALGGKLGLDEAWGVWSRTYEGMTLHHGDDVDHLVIIGGDRAYTTPAQFDVTLDGTPGVTHRLEAGMYTGCATSCATGTSTTMEPYSGTARPPGCFVEGEGTISVSFRVQCDLMTIDADRGPYLVSVSSDDVPADACVPYDVTASIDAAPSFP